MSPSLPSSLAKMASEFPVSVFIRKHSGQLTEALGKLLETSFDESGLSLLKWEEIGDGNLNFVYRVWLGPEEEGAAKRAETKEATAIIKYAPGYIRCLGPAYLLTQSRLELEYETMSCYHNLRPFCVPAPFFYDKEMSAVLMQDLCGYNVMRSDLNKGVVNIKTIENVMAAIATAHRLTLRDVLGEREHDRFCEVFKNTDMVAITELYIFVKPYQHNDDTNKHHPLLNDEVQRLRSNEEACRKAESMKKLFLEARQCLCHGDLHTGSVMTLNNDAKMFDLEFAFMGPATFDFGMFLANIIFSIIRHHCLKNEEMVNTLWTKGLSAAISGYCQSVGDSITSNDDFIADTCGFIGCELIRRVVGAAHVSDLDELPQGELVSLQIGQDFLQLKPKPDQDLTAIITELLKKRL